VVEFAPDGALEPLIDSDFLPRGSEEPELFVAVAGRQRPSLASYALVQLPLHRVLAGGAGTATRAPEKVAPPEPRGAEVRPLELERKLARQEAWIAELESRAETADARADEAQEALDALETEATRSKDALAALAAQAGELERARAELARAKAELARTDAARTEQATELERVRSDALRQKEGAAAELVLRDTRIQELERVPPAPPEASSDVEALEAKLAERGQEVRRLEHDLTEAERIGRELVRELARARGVPDPELSQRLEELALKLATSEADRLALTWAASLPRPAGTS
jgi:hypothetical protein